MTYLARKLSHYRPLDVAEAPILDRALTRHVRATQPRATLIEQGEPPGEICVIVSGWAARQKVMPDGSRQILAFHLPGDVCEFNSLLGAAADTETIALDHVCSARITKRMLNELAATAPRVSQALWWDASCSGAVQREWLINIARRGAPQRLAHLLCELHLRLMLLDKAEDDRFSSPLTQLHVANACALTAEHTNRSLRKLRDEVGILFDMGEVRFADPAAARAYAQFDGSYVLLNEPRLSVPLVLASASS